MRPKLAMQAHHEDTTMSSRVKDKQDRVTGFRTANSKALLPAFTLNSQTQKQNCVKPTGAKEASQHTL